MKTRVFTLIIAICLASTTQAQETKISSLSSSLGLYVFPTKQQDQAKQNADESACYNWAKEQTGVDPINPPKVEAAQVDRSADGTAIVGAAGGAAAGAAIGAIAGDAGKGAAIGAVAGGIRGRRAKVMGDEKAQQQNNQNASAQQKELMANFNKAFTACMEGKNYTVK